MPRPMRRWRPEPLSCAECREPIPAGKHVVRDGKPYHQPCTWPALTAVPGCLACAIHHDAIQTMPVRRAWARHLRDDHAPAAVA